MPRPKTPGLSALRLEEPAKVQAKLVAALDAHKTVRKAAVALGISERTFFRWWAEAHPTEGNQ
jgi:transposase-like protein